MDANRQPQGAKIVMVPIECEILVSCRHFSGLFLSSESNFLTPAGLEGETFALFRTSL
jgi:hypothetical protein